MAVSESLSADEVLRAAQQALEESPSAPAKEEGASLIDREIFALLARHREWVESQGLVGQRLELSDSNFEGKDLVGITLRGAVLSKANFRRAELLLADLREAHLVQADFREANLLGVDFKGANLQGARFGASSGLATGKLAKADLLGAELPESLLDFEGLRVANAAYDEARTLFWTMGCMATFSCVGLAFSSDVQLLRNLPMPLVGRALPMGGFFFVMPVLLLSVYFFFHLALHRLNERLAELPVVFPDGRPIERAGHWERLGFLSGQIQKSGNQPRSAEIRERVLSQLFCNWMTPLVLLLFWARYLVLQQMRASLLHIFLLAAAATFAIYARRIAKPFESSNRTFAKVLQRFPQIGALIAPARTAAIIAAVFIFLSLGTIYGAPHEMARAPEFSSFSARRWVPDAFWLVGYDPYARLTETNITTRPNNWLGRDQDVPSIRGAVLNQASLRYALAYRSFWVNAHLWQADLRGAWLSESDLRGVNLREASLDSAHLDHARLSGGNLQNARLQGADLTSADLHDSDLSFASAYGAVLTGAMMSGANLFSADLRASNLDHADLQKADLREAHLNAVKMPEANLQDAYLWSTKLSGADLRDAQLQRALLIDADLQKADLRGAVFQGSVTRGANFTGALIDEADFRGAIGLAPEQVCSAASRRSVTLDDSLVPLVAAKCGIQ